MGRPADKSIAFYKELRKYLETVKGEEFIRTEELYCKTGNVL